VDSGACELYLDELAGECGSTDGVRRYLPGSRCHSHAPATVAGRPPLNPPGWPAALAPRATREYGTKSDDPLGRTICPEGKRYGIPSYPCPQGCPGRPKGHKLPHVDPVTGRPIYND
jgi:hypothetical protein